MPLIVAAVDHKMMTQRLICLSSNDSDEFFHVFCIFFSRPKCERTALENPTTGDSMILVIGHFEHVLFVIAENCWVKLVTVSNVRFTE